jgi:Uma2 family endonuclease
MMIFRPGLLSPAIPDLPVYRFTVEEYHRMIDAGVFLNPVELLEGWIVPKMSKNPPHVRALQKTSRRVEQALPSGWHIRRQDPITTLESEPEPDVAVVRGAEEDYNAGHPSPADVALLVEVAESSLWQDRGTKARIFARAGIPYYWIVNLVDNQVEVYSDPTGPTDAPTYRQKQIFGPTDSVPLIIDGKEIAQIPVRDMLP